jgi:opacity protein-like surface antigen
VSYALDIGEQNALTVMGAFHNNSFSFNSYNIGLEYVFNDCVFLRASYSVADRHGIEGKESGLTSSNEDYLFGPALGAGAKLNISSRFTMHLDYAYRTVSIFDNGIQWFTVTFGL